jgi:acetyltransferase-like isoleucine patch superfamily enzyme
MSEHDNRLGDRQRRLELPGTAAGRAVASILAGTALLRPREAAGEEPSPSPSPGPDASGAPAGSEAARATDAGGVATARAVAARDSASRDRGAGAWSRLALAVANRIVGRLPGGRLRLAYYRRALGWRIGRGARIGPRLEVHGARGRVVIGSGASIAADCLLVGVGLADLVVGEDAVLAHRSTVVLDDGALGEPGSTLAAVVVAPRATVGVRALVAPGVTVGEGALVAPGAVVTESVPVGAIVGGNPARVVGERRREPRAESAEARPVH